jgi:hypothetical protein
MERFTAVLSWLTGGAVIVTSLGELVLGPELAPA